MMNTIKAVMPTGSQDRKDVPLATGVLDYFPNALAAVATVSKAGNDKHNPGEPLHWSRGKSADHADTIIRHLADRGAIDPEDGQRHSAKVAWRALALLEEELEADGATPGRGSVFPETEAKDVRRTLLADKEFWDSRLREFAETLPTDLSSEAFLNLVDQEAAIEGYFPDSRIRNAIRRQRS